MHGGDEKCAGPLSLSVSLPSSIPRAVILAVERPQIEAKLKAEKSPSKIDVPLAWTRVGLGVQRPASRGVGGGLTG